MASAARETPRPKESRPNAIGDMLVALGDWAAFAGQTLRGIITRQTPMRELVSTFYAVGVQSVPIVMITGMFIGMVLAVQTYSQFHALGMDSTLGTVINLSVVKELGPVLTGVMIAGRVGCSMAAELGTMRVTEQIDALSCLGVNPVHYLVGPRFLAALLLVPLLSVVASLMGMFGGAAICLHVFSVDPHHYWSNTRDNVDLYDFISGMVKPFFFGGALALISCHRGFHSGAGAVGVGRAATEAFVLSFLAILVLDFFLVMFLQGLYEFLWPNAPMRFT